MDLARSTHRVGNQGQHQGKGPEQRQGCNDNSGRKTAGQGSWELHSLPQHLRIDQEC